MKTNNSVRILGAVTVISLLTFSASAYIAYDTGTSTAGVDANTHNVGLQFTVGNTPVTVTSFGAFYDQTATWNVPVYVTMWDVGTATRVDLGMATFSGSAGSTGIGSGGYKFLDVPDFTLNANSTYMIVASGFGAGHEFYKDTGSGTVISTSQSGGYLTFPLNGGNYYSSFDGNPLNVAMPGILMSTVHPRYGAATFEFTPVPEVATFGAAAVGLLGLVYGARQVRIRRKGRGA